MSIDNNNLPTSAPLLECFYRNKYERVYWELISVIPADKPKTYRTEEHHIVPKCMGGHRTKRENLCYPSLRQHYILHRLLNKMYPDHEGLFYAIFRMSASVKSREYESLKSNYVRTREHNIKISQSLKGKPLSEERKRKISQSRRTSLKTRKGVNHPNSRKDLELIREEIKKVWIENGKPGDILLGQLLGLGTKKNHYRCKTLQRFIKQFKEEDIV
jgi:hypothetical protein